MSLAAARPLAAKPCDDAAHILVVDDDSRIRELVARYLAREGYRVTAAANAADARARMGALAFDLLVVDVMMPGETGLRFVERLRAENSITPVLMLTALGDTKDRIGGFEAGADDYLPKPFDPRELALRVASILRRAAPAAPPAAEAPRSVKFGGFAFDLARGDLAGPEGPIRLTERERDILRRLAAERGGIVSRLDLAGESGSGERTIDVQINRLRRKIEADPAAPLLLQTARGAGYRLILDTDRD